MVRTDIYLKETRDESLRREVMLRPRLARGVTLLIEEALAKPWRGGGLLVVGATPKAQLVGPRYHDSLHQNTLRLLGPTGSVET